MVQKVACARVKHSVKGTSISLNRIITPPMYSYFSSQVW